MHGDRPARIGPPSATRYFDFEVGALLPSFRLAGRDGDAAVLRGGEPPGGFASRQLPQKLDQAWARGALGVPATRATKP